MPLVGHDVKPLLTARFAEAPDAPPLPVAFDTQIAAYLGERRAPGPEDRRRGRGAAGPRPAADRRRAAAGAGAGLEALSSVAVRPSLEQSLKDEGVDRLFAELELPLIPILARMEAAGIALDLEALGAWTASSPPRSRGSRPRSTRPSGTSSRSAARSSWARSCSWSSGCRRAARRRRGTRPTRRCSRSCAGSTRSSSRPRLADLHEAPLDLRRGAAHAARPTGGCTRCSTRPSRRPAASTSDPNLQNIPIRTPLGRRIRHAFVAGSPDTTLVAADYSQIELRILAHVSDDTHLGTRSSARRTSTARRPRGCCASPPRRSPPTSGRWPRWSTSAWPTG